MTKSNSQILSGQMPITRGISGHRITSTLNAPNEWFCNYLPVTFDNKIDLFIDGQDYCEDLYEKLINANHSICMTGLHFMGDFALKRDSDECWGDNYPYRLDNVLIKCAKEKGVKIRLLVNLFWREGEGDLPEHRDFVINKFINGGELENYIEETYKFFHKLEENISPDLIFCRADVHRGIIFSTHHQKTVIIDNKIAYLGGIDLTHIDGDRWDNQNHRSQYRDHERTNKFWHDVHVRLEGVAVKFVVNNFMARWQSGFGKLYKLRIQKASHREVDKERLMTTDRIRSVPMIDVVCQHNPPHMEIKTLEQLRKNHSMPPYEAPKIVYPESSIYRQLGSGSISATQVVRSMPNHVGYDEQRPHWNRSADNWEHSCLDAYLIGIRNARKSIYIENQWITDKDIWNELKNAVIRNKENPDFRIVIVLPAEYLKEAGYPWNQALDIGPLIYDVIQNSLSSETFGMYSLWQCYQPLKDEPGTWKQIYVHSKVMIIDDCWSLIGSANAGGMSLTGLTSPGLPDSEISIIHFDQSFAIEFRKRLWSEHLQLKDDDQRVLDFVDGSKEFRIQAETNSWDWNSIIRIHYAQIYLEQKNKIKIEEEERENKYKKLVHQVDHPEFYPKL